MTTAALHLMVTIAAASVLAGAASAEPCRIEASTALGRCGDETCLLVTGRRSDAAAPILIAGHAVAVEGGRHWRAAVPLRMVRAWSEPFARSITVAASSGDGMEAPLPIGVLGRAVDLASLSVSARR